MKNIVNKNKIIAEFCGYKYFPNIKGENLECKNVIDIFKYGWRLPNSFILSPKMVNYKIGSPYLGRNHHCLKFHEDWNWLHYVIEKYENTKIVGDMTPSFNLCKNHCWFDYGHNIKRYFNLKNFKDKKEMVFYALYYCLETDFILKEEFIKF
jgi:hypothetical protein